MVSIKSIVYGYAGCVEAKVQLQGNLHVGDTDWASWMFWSLMQETLYWSYNLTTSMASSFSFLLLFRSSSVLHYVLDIRLGHICELSMFKSRLTIFGSCHVAFKDICCFVCVEVYTHIADYFDSCKSTSVTQCVCVCSWLTCFSMILCYYTSIPIAQQMCPQAVWCLTLNEVLFTCVHVIFSVLPGLMLFFPLQTCHLYWKYTQVVPLSSRFIRLEDMGLIGRRWSDLICCLTTQT